MEYRLGTEIPIFQYLGTDFLTQLSGVDFPKIIPKNIGILQDKLSKLN